MTTIDLEQEIIRENNSTLASEEKHLSSQAKLDAEVDKVLANADAAYKQGLMAELGFDYKLAEAQKIIIERLSFASLPQNRIMSYEAIKATCLKYGLRFLPTRYYKGALDAGIGPKLEDFKAKLGGSLPMVNDVELCGGGAKAEMTGKTQMYIAAPSESFHLQPVPRDPLLFCRLTGSKFFLIHKWGADLLKKDTEKHDIRDHNWNSPFQTVEDRDYQSAMNSYIGTINSTSQRLASSGQLQNANQFWPGSSGSSYTISLPQGISMGMGNLSVSSMFT